MILTAWTIFKVIFLAGLLFLSFLMLFSLLHPLKFNLKVRTTIKGQRGEFWFLHLFNTFRLGIVVTRHTQDIIVAFLFFKYVIKRQQRDKPQKKVDTDPDIQQSDTTQNNALDAVGHVDKDTVEEEASEISRKESLDISDVSTQNISIKIKDIPSQEHIESSEEKKSKKDAIVKAVEEEQKTFIDEPIDDLENKAEATIQVQDVSLEVDTTPIKLPSEEEMKLSQTITSSEKKVKEESGVSFKTRLRNIKKTLSKLYHNSKSWLKFGLKKWHILKPLLTRFWQRLKKGFKLDGPDIRLRYALHEHYLTGMSQGSLAILSGMLQRFGIRFVPIPEFTEPMIYLRGNVVAIVKPWRLILAATGLIFETVLWQELWRLGKWYWHYQKKHK